MTCVRIRELVTGVTTPVAVGTAVVTFWELGTRVGMWPRKADWLALEFGNCAGKLGDFKKCSDMIGMGRVHLGSERSVGGGKSQYRGTIAGSGGGKIGDCIDCVFLVGVVV